MCNKNVFIFFKYKPRLFYATKVLIFSNKFSNLINKGTTLLLFYYQTKYLKPPLTEYLFDIDLFITDIAYIYKIFWKWNLGFSVLIPLKFSFCLWYIFIQIRKCNICFSFFLCLQKNFYNYFMHILVAVLCFFRYRFLLFHLHLLDASDFVYIRFFFFHIFLSGFFAIKRMREKTFMNFVSTISYN